MIFEKMNSVYIQCVNLLQKVVVLTILQLGCGSCHVDGPFLSEPVIPDANRQVDIFFKEKLHLGMMELRSNISTDPDQIITSMDIYLFSSPDDEGIFTFQKKYSYRHDNTPVPGSTTFAIVPNGNYFTAAIHPSKGEFVKLYCVANQPLLLQQNGDPAIFTTKVTTETDFMDYTTTSILSDSLFAQLPMSGVSARIIDLTDAKATAREVVTITLKRLVARFDVKNNWADSRFALDSIGMDNGRPVATFFPVHGVGDVVSYPFQPFVGENADRGTTPRAFFCYPSPEADQGCLILKGRYLHSYGHEEPVSFRVRFKQNASDQAGGYINIEPNHRYMLEISPDVDSSNLRFLIKDWGEGDPIDDYEPDNMIQYIKFEDTTRENSFHQASRKVTLSWGEDCLDGSSFSLFTKSQSGTDMSIDFNGATPWLTKSVYKTAEHDSCVFSYIIGRTASTNATVVIKNLTGGADSVVNVVPLRKRFCSYGKENRSSDYDQNADEVIVYTYNKSRFSFTVKSRDGSLLQTTPLPFGMICESRVELRDSIKYTFLLPKTNIVSGTGKIIFVNEKDQAKKVSKQIRMKEMPAWYPAKPDSLVPSQYLGGMWWAPVNVAESVVWENRNVCPVGWVVPELHGDKSINACIPQTEVDFLDPPFTGRYWTNQRAEGSSWAYYVTFTDNRYTQTCDFTTNKCQIRCVKSR